MTLLSINEITGPGDDNPVCCILSSQWQLTNSRKIITTTMEKNQSCILQIFQLELPDPDQELFIEQWRDTKSFKNFPDLPSELRLMIWPFTYPVYSNDIDRYVSIGPVIDISERNSSIHDPRHRKQDPLPVSLYVNAESRFEALKDFCVVHRDPPPGYGKPLKPLCFRSAEDTIGIYSGFLFNNLPDLPEIIERFLPGCGVIERLRSFKSSILELTSKYPTHISKVKSLRICFHHVLIDPPSLRSLFNKNAPTGEIVEGDSFFYSAAIFHFPGLELLRISYRPSADFGFQIIMDDLTAFLEENKHRFKSGKPPKVETLRTDLHTHQYCIAT